MLKGNFIVVGVSRGKGSFEGNEGRKIDWENTKFTCLEKVNTIDSTGYKAVEYKGEYDLFDSVEIVPATYEFTIDVSNGKTKVVAVDFVGEAILSI